MVGLLASISWVLLAPADSPLRLTGLSTRPAHRAYKNDAVSQHLEGRSGADQLLRDQENIGKLLKGQIDVCHRRSGRTLPGQAGRCDRSETGAAFHQRGCSSRSTGRHRTRWLRCRSGRWMRCVPTARWMRCRAAISKLSGRRRHDRGRPSRGCCGWRYLPDIDPFDGPAPRGAAVRVRARPACSSWG